ncbi:MAG TPA: glycoside hydrolase family 25 protein [Terriglobales bacterium]|nr:glycoside hydrolase family 25 protein [Terriglobales bacterium]
MTFYIIDVSKYNPGVDFDRVRASGIQGAIVKATEGTINQTGADTTNVFKVYARQIRKANFPVYGAYHFLRPGNYGSQAANFYNSVRAAYGTIEGCLLQLDAEQAGITLADVRGFLTAWNAISGAYPLVGYFPRWFWEPVTQGPTLLNGFKGWWQSSYVLGTGTYTALAQRIARGWDAWDGITPTILQYSSSATVPGISGLCDVNQIRLPLPMFLLQCTRQPIDPGLGEENEMKLIQASGDNAIWAVWGFSRRHVGNMDQVADLEAIYGVRVTPVDASTLGLYSDLDAPASGAK